MKYNQKADQLHNGQDSAPLADYFSDEASETLESQVIGRLQAQRAQERARQRQRHEEIHEKYHETQQQLDAALAVTRWARAEYALLEARRTPGNQEVFVPSEYFRLTAKAPPSRNFSAEIENVRSLVEVNMPHSPNHSHDHGHNHADHDHSHDLEPALQSNLYSKIAFDDITTLNESIRNSGAAIVKKEWSQRLNNSVFLTSDADEQLLMHVPFTGSVKLYSIMIRTSDAPSAPKTIKLFRNRTDLDFSTASDLTPTQILQIPRSNEIIELPVNRAHFNGTTSIDLFFEDNHSNGEDEETRIGYLGFKGEWTALNREAISVVYEAAANPRDHVLMQGLTSGGQQSLGK